MTATIIEFKPKESTAFTNMKQFREAVYKYAVIKGIKLKLRRNQPDKVSVNCLQDGCEWHLYAAIQRDSQNSIIKTYNPKHSCYRLNKTFHCNSAYIAARFKDRILS